MPDESKIEQIKAAAEDGRSKRKTRDAKPSGRSAWLTMSQQELEIPGARLLQLLYAKANELGITQAEMCKRLEVNPGYLTQLKKGERKYSGISHDFATRCAKFLNLPRIAVLFAAGVVSADDYYSPDENLGERIDSGIRTLSRDTEYAPFVPASLATSDTDIKKLVLLLYQRATGRNVLPGAIDLETILGISGIPTAEVGDRHDSA